MRDSSDIGFENFNRLARNEPNALIALAMVDITGMDDAEDELGGKVDVMMQAVVEEGDNFVGEIVDCH
jgi:hypothetical protein